MKIFGYNFGCKLNLAETQSILDKAQAIGYRLVFQMDRADVIFINACHVTRRAHHKLLKMLSAIPDQKFTIVTGCLPKDFINQNHPSHWRILSSRQKEAVVPLLAKIFHGEQEKNQSIYRTRRFIKIQSGCRTRCSYCIIPAYRGGPESISTKDIINEINKLSAGTREVVLTGTNLGQYQDQGSDLNQLLTQILKRTSIGRIRVSSIDASDINQELIKTFSNSRLCQHFHLALQSGSDRILSLMRRPYNLTRYLEAVKMIKEIPDSTITTDVIVGFPGETDEDFRQTGHAIERVGFLKTHIFSYSEHPQTASARIFPKVAPEIIKQRYTDLSELSNLVRHQTMNKYLGRSFPALIEPGRAGYYSGYTVNYLPISIPENQTILRQIVPVKLIEIKDNRFIVR